MRSGKDEAEARKWEVEAKNMLQSWGQTYEANTEKYEVKATVSNVSCDR